MSKRYIFISVVFIAMAFILVLLPKHENRNAFRPDLLLLEVNSIDRFLSVDHIAERIIEGDPSILLVDVRSMDMYDEYHIPGSINIPLQDVLDDSLNAALKLNYKDIIFYSNSTLTADQAWILCRRNKMENQYVMIGGLNKWFEDIMSPEAPQDTEGSDAIALYEFRKGASVFFGMPAPIVEYVEPVKAKTHYSKPVQKRAPKKEVIILQPVEEEEEEEGC
jgi:rhodanese-related sulfurtransferase